jgi:hypothetical protein
MSYESIDDAIKSWASKHSLSLYTEYKDSEVRSVDVVDHSGKKFQIWIDKPTDGIVGVHAWDYKKRRKDWEPAVADLEETLEQAIAQIDEWQDAER